MKPIGDHGLTCLDGNDYSAVALWMQENAETIDSSLGSIEAELDTYNNAPWLILTTTVGTTFAQFTSEWAGPGSSFPGDSILGGFTIQSFGLAMPSTFPSVTPQDPIGWYVVGATSTFQATGAITANSRRDLAIEWVFSQDAVTQHEYVISSVYESNTGGDSLTVVGMLYADGNRTYTFDVLANHKNAASTMQFNSGARFWIKYVGTGLVI